MKYSDQTMNIAQNAAISTEVYDNSAGVATYVVTPSALDATTTIGFKVCNASNGTFVPLYDASGNIVSLAVGLSEARAYALPDAVRRCPFFKIWTHAAGTNVVQAGAARAFVIGSIIEVGVA